MLVSGFSMGMQPAASTASATAPASRAGLANRPCMALARVMVESHRAFPAAVHPVHPLRRGIARIGGGNPLSRDCQTPVTQTIMLAPDRAWRRVFAIEYRFRHRSREGLGRI